jgi:NADPH2:quinone reductase
MKALQLEQFSTDLSQINLIETAKPIPGPGQVLVKMLYSAINPSDFNFIRGDYQSALSRLIWNKDSNQETALAFEPSGQNIHAQTPYILGGEGVGIVEATGSGFIAKRLKGKRVALVAGPPLGTWKEYTLVDAKKAVQVPAEIDDQQAAMYLINPLAAYAMVKDILKVEPGNWLMLSGAGSALCQMVIKMAQLENIKIIAVVRSNKKSELLKTLGADVVIETDQMDLKSEVFKATNGQGVDYVMDCIGGDLLEQMQGCVTVNGHIVIYGTLSGPNCQLYSRDLMMPCAKITGFFAGNWLSQKTLVQKLIILRNLAKLTKLGIFKTDIDKVFKIEQYEEALALAGGSSRNGKVLFRH